MQVDDHHYSPKITPFITRQRFSAERLVFSNLAIMVMDVNFNNPYKTACFFFFNIGEGTKKTDNKVVKVKDCLIHAH